jgi:glyceraldehyde 3-phosphate dehydrogenase
MSVSIGINGFGRMGRLVMRAAWGRAGLKFNQVNEQACDGHASSHLLKFDSIHGIWPASCEGTSTEMQIADTTISHSSDSEIENTDWSQCDIVIEATGVHHKKPETLQRYFEQGVKKVLVAAPTEGALNIVYGVNHGDYNSKHHDLVTAASCTTNCLAPVIKVMEQHIGIEHGSMTTIHDLTNTQRIVDTAHKDLRRARASSQSLIPTTTGSAKAITKIFPALEGKLNGHAIRVPLLNASLTDFVFEAKRKVTAEEVNRYFKAAAVGELAGVLGYEERPLVSVDYVNDPRSAIVDALSTMVINETQVKIFAWYDNEWGYVCRMADILEMLAKDL